MSVPEIHVCVLCIGRTISQQTADGSESFRNGNSDARWWVGENGVVSILAPDYHSLQELRLALGGESAFVRHTVESGNDLAGSGGWSRLYDHRSMPITNATEGVWSAFLDEQLLPSASSSLFTIDFEDEFSQHDVEVLIVGGMKVLWRARVSGSEDTNAAFEFPAGFYCRDEAKNPFPGYWLRKER